MQIQGFSLLLVLLQCGICTFTEVKDLILPPPLSVYMFPGSLIIQWILILQWRPAGGSIIIWLISDSGENQQLHHVQSAAHIAHIIDRLSWNHHQFVLVTHTNCWTLWRQPWQNAMFDVLPFYAAIHFYSTTFIWHCGDLYINI